MRKRNAYSFTTNDERIRYEFVSIGPKGEIAKIVSFSPAFGEAWNLAFGDLKGSEEFDDSIISDNGDMRKVLQTLANIAHDFFEKHPNAQVIIDPVDGKRKSLYNRVFQRKFDEIELVFEVFGVLKYTSEILPYHPTKNYDAFIIQRKKPNFEK